MPESAHLWAIGFEDIGGAERLRDAITSLAGPVQCLLLRDLAVLVRGADGAYTLDRKPFPAAGNILAEDTVGFLAGIALASPLLTSEAVGEMLGLAGVPISTSVGIDDQFIRDVQAMMKPGCSVVLMLDYVGDLEESLRGLRGRGGTVLKTNVDVERVKLVQSTLRTKVGDAGKALS